MFCFMFMTFVTSSQAALQSIFSFPFPSQFLPARAMIRRWADELLLVIQYILLLLIDAGAHAAEMFSPGACSS